MSSLIADEGKTDGVSIERAIRAQRDALLRLSTGWLALVFLLPALPISPAWTMRLRVFLGEFVGLAERAARLLVMAQARVLADRLDFAFPAAAVARLSADALKDDVPPSLAELRARLTALRCLLRNLSRAGLRLLRRMKPGRGPTGLDGSRIGDALRRLAGLAPDGQCAPAAPWHPPRQAMTS